MRLLPPAGLCLLLAMLVGSAPLAREPDDKVRLRTLLVSDHPAQEAEDIHVAGQVVTALRFEREVDPAKTKLLAWEGRLEPLRVGGRVVVLQAIRDHVFRDADSYTAVLSSLNDSLKRERTLRDENQRLKQEERSVDHAYATLLAHGERRES